MVAVPTWRTQRVMNLLFQLRLVVLIGLLLSPVAQAQTLQWEDYAPVSTLVVPKHPVAKAKYAFVDAHAHQWRIGGASAQDIARLVADMDSLHMAVMVNLSGGSGAGLLRNVRNTEAHAPGRFVHFANVDFDRISEPGFGAAAAAQLEEDVKNGARGLKIFKSLGMYIFDADSQRVRTDDPRLDPIWAKCGELGIPVLIHTADPAPFWKSHDRFNERWFELKERPRRKRTPEPSWETIIGEQWNVFRKHKGTTFINAHLGWLGNDLGRLGAILDVMPNVYTELGAVVAELGRQPHTARQWLIKYQDRVLMGKDSWNPNEYHTYFRIFETSDEFFGYYRKRHAWWPMYGLNLPDEVLRKVYYKNALRIIPGLDTSLFPDGWDVAVIPAPESRPSPMRLARTHIGDAYVKVHYSSPQKRGRTIFGGLVPFGELWRTAANEATEITLTAPLTVGGEALAAGTYALFTIPDANSWTIIFNQSLGLDGTGGYSVEDDVLRITVPVTELDHMQEAFSITFEEKDATPHLVLMWDRTRVTVPITTP